jgi:hypothetical protein
MYNYFSRLLTAAVAKAPLVQGIGEYGLKANMASPDESVVVLVET